MSRAFNLFRLQQVDSQLDRLRLRLAEIGAQLGEDKNIRSAKDALALAEADLAKAQLDLRSAEHKTREQRIKIEQTELALYGGKVVSPKELQDLQMELGALKRFLETLEERQLEAMLAAEETETAHTAASRAVEQAAADRIAGDAVLTGEQTRLRAEVSRLESERSVAANAVPADDRELYDRLRIKRAGIAVTSATNRSCGACGSELNAILYQATRSPAQLTFCDTCGRVLYAG